MRRNQAPLFFLILITSVIIGIAVFIKKDIDLNTAAKAAVSEQTLTDKTPEEAELDSEKQLEEGTDGKKSGEVSKNVTDVLKAEEAEKEKLPEFETVTESYFDDALFIGDSRTVGIKKYTDLGNASFYSETGMSIYNIFDKKLLEPTISDEKKSLEDVLTENTYGKIYLMVGINELGRGTADTYFAEYSKVIERIRQLQPEAIIFIEGNMNVTKEKSDNDPIFNNVNIGIRNAKIAALANQKDIFYIDINEAITDDEGYLMDEYTFDDVHLKAKYYSIWKEFLLAHGIVVSAG